jgi:hypothetical protein
MRNDIQHLTVSSDLGQDVRKRIDHQAEPRRSGELDASRH